MRGSGGFDRLLAPHGVAIVGASDDPARIGGQPVRALKEFGYEGFVAPVNPHRETVQGLACYPDLRRVPEPCDVALIAVSPDAVPLLIEECDAAGISFAVVLSSGFEEAGEAGRANQAALDDAVRRTRVRVIGPNCQGVLSPGNGVYAGFGAVFQTRAPVLPTPAALVTQSGGFGYAVVGLAREAGIGFSHVVSTGNEADVEAVEVASDLIGRDEVDMLALYLEGARDGRRLIDLGRLALELRKPIAVWKVGNSAAGRAAAASHTAKITADYEIYRAVFKDGGFIEIRDADELIDLARAVRSRRRSSGRDVAVLSVSGGAGVLAADRLAEESLRVPSLSRDTHERLREKAPPFSSLRNPVDLTGQVLNTPESLREALGLVLADPAVDQAVVYNASMRGPIARRVAAELVAAAGHSDKPVQVGWTVPPPEVVSTFDEHRLPWYPTPARAVRAAAALTRLAEKEERGPTVVPPLPARRVEVPDADRTRTLSEYGSKRLLSAWGIPVTREVLLDPGRLESLSAPPLPFPVAVKASSSDLPHKADVGGVCLGVGTLEELKVAAREVVDAAEATGAAVEGVLVQEMSGGIEAFAGSVNDPHFGPVVAVGLGGVFVEVLGDVTHRVAAFGIETAREMIEELRAAPLLRGARGTPPADIEALASALVDLASFATVHRDRVGEVDINPLFVHRKGEGVTAADALVTITPSLR